MKKLILLGLAASLALVAFHTSSFNKPVGASEIAIIDGAERPEMIPDRVAYSLLFRLLSSGRNETEKQHLKSYIARIELSSDDDINALFSAAAEYARRVNSLDVRVNAIKEQENHHQARRSPTTQQLLQEMQAQYDLTIDEIVNSLSKKLSKDGEVKLNLFMDQRFKKNVKLRSSDAPIR
jgi:hypothetical protein